MEKCISEYFFRAQKIVDTFNPDNSTVIQFFQRGESAVLAGISEALEFLKPKLAGTGTIVRHLEEGSLISEREVVLELEGRYQDFGIYEGILDGILARNTSIATNSRRCLEASRGREIICMSDRSDHYCNQERDGRAMYTGGIRSFSSKAQAPSEDCVVYTSIPHALIQNFKGDLTRVMEHYGTLFPDEDLVALVDFHNDVIGDSLAVLSRFGERLKGVRVDTSISMRDAMFSEGESEYGVTPNQIKNLRRALDESGGGHVKIYVSSGFNPRKISLFEEENTPVDAYGVGEYLLRINNTFSADCVKIDGVELAKEGRRYRANPRLVEFICE